MVATKSVPDLTKVKRMTDRVLILIAVFLFVFTVVMIAVYVITGGVPDVLVSCVFVACTGECGFTAWIKSTKVRWQDREWELEDEERGAEKKKVGFQPPDHPAAEEEVVNGRR